MPKFFNKLINKEIVKYSFYIGIKLNFITLFLVYNIRLFLNNKSI